MSWAKPGVACQCIADSKGWRPSRNMKLWTWLRVKFLGLPTLGGVYVVTATCSWDGSIHIQLRGFGNVWFPAYAFRPLQKFTQSHDVAKFEQLLTTAPAKAPKVPV